MLIVLLHKANSPNITNRDSLNNDDAEMRHIGNLMRLQGTNNLIQLAEFTVGVGGTTKERDGTLFDKTKGRRHRLSPSTARILPLDPFGTPTHTHTTTHVRGT
jgi:hypothetical protein